MSALMTASYVRAHAPPPELDAQLDIVEGRIPRDLRGTLYRNGPGTLSAHDVAYDHPFDGDGMVLRFHFDEGSVSFRNRWVRTMEFEEEARAKRPLYRSFGTNLPGGLLRNAFRMRFKNAANTSVVLHAGALYALWEGGLPHRLDPITLDTLGRHDFDGRLRSTAAMDRMLLPELPFSAHPKLDDEGTLWNFGTAMGPEPRLMIYRIDREGRMAAPRTIKLDALTFVHDFVCTARHLVFFLSPVSFDMGRAVLGLSTPAASLRASGVGEVLIVPRDGGPERRLPLDEGFIFHFANGYDRDGSSLIVDGYRMERMPDLAAFEIPEAHLTRFVVDLAAGTVSREPLSTALGELPIVARSGSRHRYVWSMGLPSSILKTDCDERSTIRVDFEGDLLSEPVFVPRPGGGAEDDGYLLVLRYLSDAHRSELLVLDAKTLERIARARLPTHVPPGFHGIFVNAK